MKDGREIPIIYYNLQFWSETFGRWRTLAHGPLDVMRHTEDDLIKTNMLHSDANTRVIRATGDKENHFGEGNYDYQV